MRESVGLIAPSRSRLAMAHASSSLAKGASLSALNSLSSSAARPLASPRMAAVPLLPSLTRPAL